MHKICRIFILSNCLFLLVFLGIIKYIYSQNNKNTLINNQNEKIFNLQQCIDYAYNNNNTILNSDIDRKIAKAKIYETITTYLPKASITSYLNSYPTIKSSVVNINGQEINMQMGSKFDSGINLRIDQLVFKSDAMIGIMSSNLYKDLYSKTYRRNKRDIKIAVSKAYYNILVSKEQLQMLDASISRLAQTLRETKALKEQGMAEDIEVRRIEVLYNNTVTEKNNALKYQELVLALLKYQMGMPNNESIIINDSIQPKDLVTIEPKITEDYVSKRIEYSLLETQLNIEKNLHKINILSFLPTIGAFAVFGNSYMNDKFSQLYSKNSSSKQLGLTLTLPIFTSGERISKIIQSKYAVQKAINNLDSMKKTIHMEIEDAHIKYIAALAEIKNQLRNRDLAKEVVRVSNIKYVQGLGSSLEVTTAEESLRNAETNYIQSLYNAFIAKFDLEKSMGNYNQE